MKHKNTTHGLSRHPLYRKFIVAKNRCTNPNHPAYKTYRGRWKDNSVLELTLFYKESWERKVRENPDEVWSIDRVDNSLGYSIGNIQIIPKSENSRKGIEECDVDRGLPEKKPVKQFTIDGVFVKDYPSASAAGRSEQNTAIATTISKVCRGEGETSGGYKWAYA